MKGPSSTTLTVIACILAFTSVLAAPPPVPTSANPGAWLGVRLANGDGTSDGVAIGLIIEDGPAHRMGLRARDRILAVDGHPVGSASELVSTIQNMEPGSWVELQLERSGEPWDVRVRLDERPVDLSRVRMLRGWLGVEAIELPLTLREHFGAPADAGVMISAIAEGSPAEAAGVELGDVLFEVDGEAAGSVGQLAALIAGSGIGNEIELRLARSGLEVVLETVVEAAPDPARD